MIKKMYGDIKEFFAQKRPSDMDTKEVRTIKGLIRRGEARTACTYNGIPLDHVHFLDLPFYESGKIEKLPMGEADVKIVRELLQQVKPHQIYVAGDLATRTALTASVPTRDGCHRPREGGWRQVARQLSHLDVSRRMG